MGGRRRGWRRLDLAGEISQKKKVEIAFRERNLPNAYVPTRLCKTFSQTKAKVQSKARTRLFKDRILSTCTQTLGPGSLTFLEQARPSPRQWTTCVWGTPALLIPSPDQIWKCIKALLPSLFLNKWCFSWVTPALALWNQYPWPWHANQIGEPGSHSGRTSPFCKLPQDGKRVGKLIFSFYVKKTGPDHCIRSLH